MRLSGLVTACLILGWSVAQAADDDWPRWRGPNGDCTSRETGLLEQWPEGGPKELWRRPVGLGFASPVAVDGRVYAFGTISGKDTLTCLSADTGDVVWTQASAGGWTGGHPGTRATPTIENGRVYTFGGKGDLIGRELGTGKQLWSLDVIQATGGKPPMWASASCPTILGDLVYVQVGENASIAIAVNKNDGKIAWQSEEKGKGSYAAVWPIQVNGATQLLAFGGKAVVAMEPATGKTLWTQPWTTQYDINAVSPLYRDGHLFITSGYGRGCAMFTCDGKKTEKLWEKKEPHNRMVPPLLEGEHLFVTNEGSLMCLRWPTGEVLWKKELNLGLGGQYVRLGDRMILLGDTGELILAQVTPKEYKGISSVRLFKASEIWATPLVYRGRLYVKGRDELVCLDVAAPLRTDRARTPR
jgi:outer membrane protein assembly factor BamB